MALLDFIGYSLLSGVLLYVALLDFLYYRIPNKAFSVLFYGFVVYGLGVGLLTGQWGLINHFWVFAITFCLTFFLFAIGFMGGGDAKFISAVMLWVGPEKWQLFLIAMSVIGCLIAAIFFVSFQSIARTAGKIRWYLNESPVFNRWHSYLLPQLDHSALFYENAREKKLIPYGIAVSVGGLLTFWLPRLW